MPKPLKKATAKPKPPARPKRPCDPNRGAHAMLAEHMARVQEEPAAAPAAGVSKKAVSRLLVEAAEVAAEYQNRVFRNLTCRRIPVDELWGFNYVG